MIIRLQHPRSDGDVDTYHLKSGRRYHIGRGSACEVRILDLKLSRKHCAVEYNGGEWRVIDLASTNGCKVDGDQIVGSVPLTVGSKIEIGQTAITVLRILGDDESEEDDDTVNASPAKSPAKAPVPTGANGTSHLIPSPRLLEIEPPEAIAPKPVPAAPMPGAKAEPGAKKKSAADEHDADDWDPEPAPEAATKTGALVPNPAADAQADLALESARRAAMEAAKPGIDGTGEIQRPGRLGSPSPERPLPAQLPRSTPLPQHPTPLPTSLTELESGPYKSLEPQAGKPAAPRPPVDSDLELELITPQTPPAPPERKSGTETRRRQGIQPVIVKPMSDDELAAIPPAPPAQVATPTPVPPRPPAAPAPRVADAPVRPLVIATGVEAPKADAPVPAPAAGDERTFYITVLGRRVGPLTRAVARDLKARELKGTLTLKDLEIYS